MFTDSQKTELAKPLDRAHVATRQQSGRALSYVESWHVIAEANRIFGFDAWSSETVELRVVSEKPRKIGRPPNEKDGWGVSYLARVRVTVGDIVREGTGVGHGIDTDIGQAHESASKEAESDARKRALMTFGNPFGLALYDKQQANVVDAPPVPPAEPSESLQQLRRTMRECHTKRELAAWLKQHRAAMDGLAPAEFSKFEDEYVQFKSGLGEVALLNAA